MEQLKDSVVLIGLVSKVADRMENLIDVCVIRGKKEMKSQTHFYIKT